MQFLINNIISSLYFLFIVIIVSQNSIKTIVNSDSILEAHTYPRRLVSLLLFNSFFRADTVGKAALFPHFAARLDQTCMAA